MNGTTIVSEQGGLRVVAYPGDNKILLAMSLDAAAIDEKAQNLAGFAIFRTLAGQPETPLRNRIGFDVGVTQATTAQDRKWTPSDQAPFQKFRWIDVPPDFSAPITYRVRVRYFTGKGFQLKDGPQATVTVPPIGGEHACFRVAFTRGYIASQAYADRFQNKDIRPAGAKTADFDTKPFAAQYEWLGASARRQLLAFIAECEKDTTAQVNVFAYDLDEPDVIAAICRIGKQQRLKAILDNADLHAKPNASGVPPIEVTAAKMIIAAAGKANVRQGKFSRFQHNKVFIKRDAKGVAQKVLFGSMNFSVRGLYVQANNIMVVDDAKTAGVFARAFDVAFAGDVKTGPFVKDAVSAGFTDLADASDANMPKCGIAVSPHASSDVSLGPVAHSIRASASSVLFAVMEPDGSGPVLSSLRQIAATPTVFSYGTVETATGLAVQNPEGAMGEVTSFAALTKNVPPPFTQEFSGGTGMHIHDKFVVVDFNGANPVVFTGSSNLASGGEEANGDSLIRIEDAGIAQMFAIEAVALFDHYHFRRAMQEAPVTKPFTLWFPGKPDASATPWWQAFYDRTRIQMRDRYLFAGLPLPPGVAAVKTVDWASLDTTAAGSGTPASGRPVATKPSSSKPVSGKPSSGKPSVVKPTAVKPIAVKPIAVKPTSGKRPLAAGSLGAKKPVAGRKPVVAKKSTARSKPAAAPHILAAKKPAAKPRGIRPR